MQRVLLEICVETLRSAVIAAESGADRLELCSALSEGGLTPGYGFTQQVVAATQLPVMMMIRPRGGSFVYDAAEIEIMEAEMQAAKSLGVAGFVFGALTPDGHIDVPASATLLAAARPLPATFHRAFDELRAPLRGLQQLRQIGCDRVLTSGQQPTAIAGTARLRELVEAAEGGISIIAGGGLQAEHAATLVRQTGVEEVHGTASVTERFTHPAVPRETSAAAVAAIRQALDNLAG